jgi:DNA-directed RNA polymerase specialized sigma subunit
MSKLKRAYQAFSPFPKAGLVKDYERFIRQEVNDYCKQYPDVRKQDMLAEAVRIAVEFEPKFNPETAKDFSTPLRWHLKGLHRFAQKEFSSWQIPVSKNQRDANKLEAKRNGVGGDDPRAVNFEGGGNGARITLDLQWTNVTPISDLIVTYNRDHDPTTMFQCPEYLKRWRVVIGTQLRNSDLDHANGVMDRAIPDVKVVLEDRKPSPITDGYIRAVIDHNERRQRETDQEAENQRHGDYDPVFFEVVPAKFDLAFYHGRNPPNFNPDYIQNVSLSDAYTHDDDWVGNLADTIADGASINAAADHADQHRIAAETERLRGIVDAERPFLSPKEATVLFQRTLGNRPIAEVAAKVGMTKGGVSKMEGRIVERLTNRLRGQK